MSSLSPARRLAVVSLLLSCCVSTNNYVTLALVTTAAPALRPNTANAGVGRRAIAPCFMVASSSSGSSTEDHHYAAAAFSPTTSPSSTTTTSLSSAVVATHDMASPEDTTPLRLVDPVRFETEFHSTTRRWTTGMSLAAPSLLFARCLILAASAVYGTNFAVVKMLDEQVPFAVSAALRFVLAATVVTTLVLHGERPPPSSVVDPAVVVREREERNAATWAGMEIGAWYCLGYLSQSVGLQTADASKSAFFNALAVIVVPLLDSFFRGKQMGPKEISSVALAIAGVGLLQLGPSMMEGVAIHMAQGDLFCLAQALLFGIGYWRLEAISSQHPTQAGRITVGQLIGVALGATVFLGTTQSESLPTLMQLQTWFTDPFIAASLLWTALVSTALALYLETVALKAVSAAELTVLMTSVSIFGSGFAYVTMGETMSPIGMVGGLMILVGCVFSSLGGSPVTTKPIVDEEFTGEVAALLLVSSSELDNSIDIDFASPVPEEAETSSDWDTNSLGLERSSIAL